MYVTHSEAYVFIQKRTLIKEIKKKNILKNSNCIIFYFIVYPLIFNEIPEKSAYAALNVQGPK